MRCANIIGNAVHEFGIGCVCIRWFGERKKKYGLVRTCFLGIRCHFEYVSVCFWIHSSVNACTMFSERLIPLKLIYWINSSDCGNGTVHSLWITTDFIRFDRRVFATKNVCSKLLWSILWFQWKRHSKYASREHLLLEEFALNWFDNFHLMIWTIEKNTDSSYRLFMRESRRNSEEKVCLV